MRTSASFRRRWRRGLRRGLMAAGLVLRVPVAARGLAADGLLVLTQVRRLAEMVRAARAAVVWAAVVVWAEVVDAGQEWIFRVCCRVCRRRSFRS